MNQNEQMPIQSPVPLSHAEFKVFKLGWLECLAAHVNKMPKNEHVEADVSNKARNLDMMREALRVAYHAGNLSGHDNTVGSRWSSDVDDEAYEFADAYIAEQALAAKPAPLVRLTDEELKKMFGYEYAEDFYHANAIMDAMERKNGGAA